jgi:hypothetical protein
MIVCDRRCGLQEVDVRVFPSLGVMLAVAMATGAGPATAHHSQVMYDGAKRISLTGRVKSYRWVNPHVQFTLEVTDAEGRSIDWEIEGSSVTQLRARGWARNSLAAGDLLTVIVHPLRSGAPGGTMTSATRADGSPVGRRAEGSPP